LMVRLGTVAYLRDRDLNAPEEVLEALHDYFTLAAHILARADAANANAGTAGAMPANANAGAAPASPQIAELMAG